MTRWKPSPWQRWQQPCGELKEKIRGSSSGIEVPHSRHAKRSENSIGSRLRVAAVVASGLDLDQAVRELRGGLDGLREALSHALLHHQAVDHDRDLVLELLVELDLLVEPAQLAVDPRARIALGAHLLQQPPVLALAPADHRAP